MTSLVKLYQEELKLLKDSAQVFSEEHPALTESLTRDSVDPDVEMILQGVSYLTAQFKREINDQFPVALQALSQALAPSLMQPIPAVSILSMEPKANLLTPLRVKKGRGYDSSPVVMNDNANPIACRFTNVWPIEVLPIKVAEVLTVNTNREINGRQQPMLEVKIQLDATKNNIANYQFDKLRLFINQPISDASLWMLMLGQQLQSVEITDTSGSYTLAKNTVSLTGFNNENNLFDNGGSSSLHQTLQEYFMVPEKFQFIDLDLSTWQQRNGEHFEISFVFHSPSFHLPALSSQHIKLYCSPVVNEFEHFAEPVAMNGVQLEFPLIAKQRNASVEQDLPIIDVLNVESIKRDRERNRRYQNLVKPQTLTKKKAGYHFYRKNGNHDGVVGNWLALQFEPGTRPEEQEILRIKVKCCHGELASKINPGEIKHPTSSSPELVNFANLTSTTDYQPAVMASHAAWQVVSDQALSLQSITNAQQLKEILSHHIPSQLTGSAKQKTLQHRIAAIETLSVEPQDNFEKGMLTRGVRYNIALDSGHFINNGESFLFSALLDQIFALQVPLNSFSQLSVTDTRTGHLVLWPIRLDTRC